MLGRLAGKWVQLFSDGAPWSRLAPTQGGRTRQQSSAELGMAELYPLLRVGCVVWSSKSKPLMCRHHLLCSPLYIVGSMRPPIHKATE